MAATLVNDLTGLFKTQALGEAAAQLGESESSVLRGFQAAAASIVSGLAGKVGQAGFMKQAFDLITSPVNDGRFLDNIRGFFSGRSSGTANEGLSGRMLSMLFGGDQSRVAEGISQASGVRPSSASALMGVAAPMVLGLLGRRVQEDHLDQSGLTHLIQDESASVRSFLPSTATPIRTTVAPAAETTRVIEERAAPGRWLWPLLLALLAIFGLFWLLNRGREAPARVAGPAAVTEPGRQTWPNLGEMIHVKLADGTDLVVPQHGLESTLVAFIQDPSRQVDATTWFEFDRLNFDTNLATLRPESREQLTDIAEIMKAYPAVHVKIGGYTDNTGDPSANMQLSQARADSVKDQLISMGVAPDRLEAQGYGDQHPIANNATPEGRAQNRRIALRVTAK
jgi:OmpA-OmpF porin, OOP family